MKPREDANCAEGETPRAHQGIAKRNHAGGELEEAPNLMRTSKKLSHAILCAASSSSANPRISVLSCPIASRISLLLGWLFTIVVVFYCEDYTERLAKFHTVSVVQNQAAKSFSQQQLTVILELQEHAIKTPSTNFCEGRLVYVYNISEVYNREFVRECASFKKGRNLCMYMENWGMGRAFGFGAQQGGPSGGESNEQGPWHNTWQFALELYFHERLLRHPCLTTKEELANAFFIPYYAGMDLSRRFTHRMAKGELYVELAKWLQGRESWKRHQGRDHFMVLGRIASDFHRPGGGRSWGNEMLRQRPFKEIVTLSIERASAKLRNSASINKEVAIPYPTYFHASSDGAVRNLVDWLGQTSQRVSLVTMAAGMRQPSTNRMRHRLMTQCGGDPRCTLLLCVGDEASPSLSDEMRNVSLPEQLEGKTLNVRCNNPPVLLSAMHQSEFCLQPPGDSPTRRSFFDAMLVGCIPVIFQREAAWSQYVHHLPENGETYSVFIPMALANKSNVINILSEVKKSKILQMRANIAKLVPRILYARMNRMPSETQTSATPDAFDIALDAVLGRIKSRQQFTHDVNSS